MNNNFMHYAKAFSLVFAFTNTPSLKTESYTQLKEQFCSSAKFNYALKTFNEDTRFFKLKAFFQKPSTEKCCRMRAAAATLREAELHIQACIEQAQRELSCLNETHVWRDTGNIALDIVRAILLAPLATVHHMTLAEKTVWFEKEIKTLQKLRVILLEKAAHLEELVRPYTL